MALQRKATLGGLDHGFLINVFCLKEKGKIVFTGYGSEVANFLGVPYRTVTFYLSSKARFRKKYALRIKKAD